MSMRREPDHYDPYYNDVADMIWSAIFKGEMFVFIAKSGPKDTIETVTLEIKSFVLEEPDPNNPGYFRTITFKVAEDSEGRYVSGPIQSIKTGWGWRTSPYQKFREYMRNDVQRAIGAKIDKGFPWAE